MADDLGLGSFTPMISGGVDTAWTLIIVGGILLFVAGICWFFYWYTSYNIFYRIRELTGDKTRIIDEKAKRVKTKEGIIKWKLRMRRDFVPIAPAEAIHLTKKGKLSVEAYYTPEHEYKYINDTGEELIKQKEKSYDYLIDKGIEKNTVSGFQSITTSDREFYANEERLAQKYIKKNWTDYILPIAGMLGIIIIVVCMFMFWEDITKPTLEAQKTNIEVMKIQVEMLTQIQEIMRHAQIIPDYNGTVPEIPQTLQPVK